MMMIGFLIVVVIFLRDFFELKMDFIKIRGYRFFIVF